MKKIITLLCVASFISCEDGFFDFRSDIEIALSKCKSDYFDRSTTFQKIQGNWKLVGEGCGGCSSSAISSPKDNIEIRIKSDSTISTFKNGVLLKSTFYTFFSSNPQKSHFLKAVPMNQTLYTHGVIEFRCELLSFRGGHTDGADYYFQKIK